MSDAIEKYTTHIRTTVLEERVRTLQARLETTEKERDEARNLVEQWRELLCKRKEVIFKCADLEQKLLEITRDASAEESGRGGAKNE